LHNAKAQVLKSRPFQEGAKEETAWRRLVMALKVEEKKEDQKVLNHSGVLKK